MKDYILLITLHADPAMPPGYNEWGGTHTYMRELLDEWGKRELSCLLVTRKSMRQLPDVEVYNNSCTIYRITVGEPEPMDKTKLLNYHNDNLIQLQDIIAKQETLPRIIHSVYWNSGRLAVALSEELHVPFVHSIISNSRGRVLRGASEPVPERACYEQEIYDKSIRLICVSDDERNDLMTLYHIPPEKIVVAGQYIHHAFLSPAHDFNNFPRIGSHISSATKLEIAYTYNHAYGADVTECYWAQKMFTYIGRMDMTKGLNYIFLAWDRLRKRYGDVCPSLWLVGGSLPEIESVRKRIRAALPELPELERSGKVLWWGYLDPEGLSTVLLKSCVLVTHSLYEPGGRVAIEAMGEGVPVLATPNGFAMDAIHDWHEGFLVNHGDVDTLALRMEHFIRQPYLSNALGLNARQRAAEVMEQWDFFGRHLSCYGDCPDTEHTREQPLLDHFERKKIDLFPYCNQPFSQELISNFFSRSTGDAVIRVEQGAEGGYTSDICQISGTSGAYIIKRTFTRLATSPLFNPICKDRYARRADKHYRVEFTAYQRQESDVLVGHDDLHYLLLLKALKPHRVERKEDLTDCIGFLLSRPNLLKPEEAARFCEIIGQPLEELAQLERVMCSLCEEFADYYFEVSGVFSNQICWKIAPHLVEYNRQSLNVPTLERLQYHAQRFSALPAPLCPERLRDINTDTELKHIREHHGQICMIDFEKTSIGTVEADIAGLLFDYLLHHGDPDLRFWPWVLTQLVRYDSVQVQDVLSSTAFRFFYECIVQAALYRKIPPVCMDQLEMIAVLLGDC